MLLVNAWWDPLTFRLPGDDGWSVELDTANATPGRRAAGTLELAGRSLVLLRAIAEPTRPPATAA
jgi:pullulanase/glycogen debranching enzyme